MVQAESEPHGLMPDKAVPVLASLDLDRTANFYRYFGFIAVQGAEVDGSYLHLRRGEVELGFSLSDIDHTLAEHAPYQRMAIVYVADLDAWQSTFRDTRMAWKALFPSLNRVREDLWDGRRSFSLTDKDGNLIWFVERQGVQGKFAG
jgi:hypothetical protein